MDIEDYGELFARLIDKYRGWFSPPTLGAIALDSFDPALPGDDLAAWPPTTDELGLMVMLSGLPPEGRATSALIATAWFASRVPPAKAELDRALVSVASRPMVDNPGDNMAPAVCALIYVHDFASRQAPTDYLTSLTVEATADALAIVTRRPPGQNWDRIWQHLRTRPGT